MERFRLPIAVLVFLGWFLVVAFVGGGNVPSTPQPLNQSIAGSLQPNLVAAVVFLLAVVAALRWRDVGLNPPRPHSLRLLWFPSLYIVVFVALCAVAGLPPPRVVLTIFLNTALAGVGEELACRGVLYQGLRVRFGVWPAVVGSTLLFGAVHILNGFSTGDFRGAALQAGTAFLTGIAFMAIRVRTGSLYPGMVLHAVWDFTLLVAVTGVLQHVAAPQPSAGDTLHGAMLLAPFLLVLPNFLYGLFLLRHTARDARAGLA